MSGRRRDSWQPFLKNRIANEDIFQLIQFSLSISSLVYLQTLLAYYSRQRMRYVEEAVHQLGGASDENTYTEPRNECYEEDDTLSSEERNIFEQADAVNSNIDANCGKMNSLKNYVLQPSKLNFQLTISYCNKVEQKTKNFVLIYNRNANPVYSNGGSSGEPPSRNIQANNFTEPEEADSIIQAFGMLPWGKKKLCSLGHMFGDNPKFGKRVSVPFAQHPVGSNLYLRLGAVGRVNIEYYK
ncbi:hypothetical protein ACTXT7_010685 [Hymenolepis weldensis]